MRGLTTALMGYPEWEDARVDRDHAIWAAVAIEVRPLKADDHGAFVQAVKDWLNQVASQPNKGIVYFPHEKERLFREIDTLGWSLGRIILLMKRTVLNGWQTMPPVGFSARVLSVGQPFMTLPLPVPDKPKPATRPGQPDEVVDISEPIIGIIDDGIAFLNARFCTKVDQSLQTRFLGVWQQSEVDFQAQTIPPPEFEDFFWRKAQPVTGILEPDHINNLLTGGVPEADIYRDKNAELYPPPSQQATNTSTAHGTHVPDLAAGAEPETGGPPLLAVQLAPDAATDTSGRRLESFLIMGLRWIVWRAFDQGRHLVVNISLGSLAGPGDASNAIADAIAHEIKAFAALSVDRQMTVVVAYGNSWRSNLVADFALEKGHLQQSVDWRILPDDYSSNFLEVRVPLTAKGVHLTLAPPDGTTPLEFHWDAAGPGWSATAPGASFAAVLPVSDETNTRDADDQRNARAVLLAVAPTTRFPPPPRAMTAPPLPPLAPAGAWKVTVKIADGARPCPVTLRVQRNDTPVGYRVHGRQSYLADNGLDGWDDETGDYVYPKGSAISRRGTANSYAGLPDLAEAKEGTTVIYVGAARPDPGKEGKFLPSLYTSEGFPMKVRAAADPWDIGPRRLHIRSEGPTLAAQGDDGRFFSGQRATSVTSGAHRLRLTPLCPGLAVRFNRQGKGGMRRLGGFKHQSGKSAGFHRSFRIIGKPRALGPGHAALSDVGYGGDQMHVLVKPGGFDGQAQPAHRHDHRRFARRDVIDIHLCQIGDQARYLA